MILAHGAVPPEPAVPDVLLRWHPDPLALLALAVPAGLYWLGVRRMRRWPRHRAWCFSLGMAVMAVALVGPVAAYDTTLFTWHMVQHVLLTMIAAPLLLLGAPVTLALRATPPRLRRRVVHPVVGVLGRVAHPVLAWLLFTVVMWWSHYSGLFDAALEHAWLHRFEHGLYVGAALLFWWPALGVDPGPRRMPHPVRALYLFLAMPQNTFLALSLYGASRPRYEHYVTLARDWGPTPLQDQKTAAGIMWVVGDLVFLAAVIVVMAMWAKHEERMAVLMDARLDAEEAARAGGSVVLSPRAPQPPWPRTGHPGTRSSS